MRLFITIALTLLLSANCFAQYSSDNNLITGVDNPEVSLSISLTPHRSSFSFVPSRYDYRIKPISRSVKTTPLLNLHFSARTNYYKIGYTLQTTYPLAPEYDIYTYDDNLVNRSNFREWTHTAEIYMNIYENILLGLAYHHRNTSFRGNTLDDEVNFEFKLRDQNNLLLVSEIPFMLKQFYIKPSFSYSLKKWSGSGKSYFDRSAPDGQTKNYYTPINRNTFYIGWGLVLGNNAIAKNIRLNLRYEFHDNFALSNKRYLLGIQYKFDMLE